MKLPAWSTWSECTPFCDNSPKRTRTRRVKQENKCVTKTEEQGGCEPRGGCAHECVNKKCSCYSGYTLVGGKFLRYCNSRLSGISKRALQNNRLL